MRLIPKKTKINSTVWKSFTLVDVLIAFAMFLVAAVIGMSNIPGKWYIDIAVVGLSVVMLLPLDDVRVYAEIGYLFAFLFSRKKFSVGATARKSVDALVPNVTLEKDGTLDYGGYYGAVVALSSIEFALRSEWQQNECITALSSALGCLSLDEIAQIVKVDRPINFDEIALSTYSKLRGAEGSDDRAKTAVLKSRLEQIDLLNNVERQYRPYYYIVFYSDSRDGLSELVEQASLRLSVCGLSPVRLNDKETAVFLKYCYGRDFDEHDVEALDPADYIEWIKPQSVEIKSDRVIVDGKTEFTYAVSDYPLSVGNGWGAEIFNIDNTKAVLTFRRVDRDAAIKRIDRTIVEIGTRENSAKASELIAQDTHLSTMGALLQNLQNENESLFDCELTVTGFFRGETDKALSAFRRSVRQGMVSNGFRVSPLRCRQLDGYIAGSVTRRMPLKSFARGINSESLAAVFPFVFTSVIEPNGVTLGMSGAYPFIFDAFKWNDKAYFGQGYTNANMFVAGTSGSGKSYFAKTLLTALYSENTRIYILDPENEYKQLCRNVGGSFIDVGSASSGRINPFHIYQTLTEDGELAPPQIVWNEHLQYLENFFRMTLPEIPQDTFEELNNLIVELYERRGINRDTDCSTFAPEAFPTFDDFYALVRSELGKTRSGMRCENLQRAVNHLAKFASGGRFAGLWNGASTLRSTDRFTVFNFQSLFQSKNRVTSNGQMLTVLRFLEQQIINLREINGALPDSEKIHPIVVLDEGYMFIDEKNPISLDFVYQWYKRIRKYGGAMIFLTQNLADIVGNSDIIAKTSAIINNAQYSFIFTLQGRDVEVLQDIYASRGLTDAEIYEVQRTDKPKGTAFFMGSATQRAVINIVASQTAVELFDGDITFELDPIEHEQSNDIADSISNN